MMDFIIHHMNKSDMIFVGFFLVLFRLMGETASKKCCANLIRTKSRICGLSNLLIDLLERAPIFFQQRQQKKGNRVSIIIFISFAFHFVSFSFPSQIYIKAETNIILCTCQTSNKTSWNGSQAVVQCTISWHVSCNSE